MTRPVLQVIIGSTRPGRIGPSIATWFEALAAHDGAFDVELVDLAQVNLPLYDEPRQPMTGHYEHEHTRAWAAMVSRADAFVFVVPEYNHSFNAATKNALDYLYREWLYRPVGLVGYGGTSAGTRSLQHLKTVLSALKMVPAGDVAIAHPGSLIVDGVFSPSEAHERAARALVHELAQLVPLLAPLRPASTGS